jgi:malate synthase
MMINALNSGAQIYMTDLEDSQSPEWFSLLQAYQNINDACKGTLSYTQKAAVPGANDKVYNVVANPATMIVRPRGLHMLEKHIIDESGRPAPANLIDIVMYMFHNAKDLIAKGSRPLLYQPKLESFEEAVLVHDIIQQVEKHLGIPYGTTRVTALIETLPGLLQAEEIGFGLGKYWAGLNCGRWDYLFSLIKNNSNDPNIIYPDRDLLNMKTPFLSNYMMRVVQVCHSRGVHAMGGMSAFIPSKDLQKAQSVLQKVVADKEFEVQNGMDGAWVAHPGLVKDIQSVFEKGLKGSTNQITSKVHLEAKISTSDLISLPKSLTDIKMYTEAGLRNNISVGVLYIASWLGGNGAVAINGLMEDMATAEISRSQVWQWLKYKKEFTRFDGSVAALDIDTFREILEEEVLKQKEIIQSSAKPFQELCHKLNNLTNAAELFKTLVQSTEIIPFIQDVAGELLNQHVVKPKPLRTQFTAIKFSEDEKASLRGTRPEITLDARLAIIRGNNFNKVMSTLRSDGLVSHGSFIGTPNGHSARNVVEGGLGETWPYVGGWELNARGLNLGQPMPDTLSVSFHEQGELAQVINRFLEVADRVQELEVRNELAKIEKLPTEKQAAARERIMSEKVDYLSSPMLADLEQGWGDPKKVFVSVIRCLQNGVNVMHIEDQYSLKRCGHLGGKGLDDVNGWKVIFKAANLAANLFHGVKLDGPNQNVNFVARTDALSAEFIQYSKHMHEVSHPDHAFIDWDRGFTPDGRYLYLKKGVNPATGKKYGLEHSAVRCAEIVKGGMASHVWVTNLHLIINETFP